MVKIPNNKTIRKQGSRMSAYTATGLAEGWLKPTNKNDVKNAFQYLADTGLAWKLQGSTGRATANLLQQGLIKFPKIRTFDYYGNAIPTRKEKRK